MILGKLHKREVYDAEYSQAKLGLEVGERAGSNFCIHLPPEKGQLCRTGAYKTGQ